jgi:hypothetical protein
MAADDNGPVNEESQPTLIVFCAKATPLAQVRAKPASKPAKSFDGRNILSP